MKAETKAEIMALGAFILVVGVLSAAIAVPYTDAFSSRLLTEIDIDFAIIVAALGAAILAFGAGLKSE